MNHLHNNKSEQTTDSSFTLDIEQLLKQGNVIRIKPQGTSMYPLFVPGRDEACIERTDFSSLKRGDVILYRRDKSILVLHRIWKITNNSFYMVGDNQTEIEGPLRADQVRGKLTAFVAFFTSPPSLFLETYVIFTQKTTLIIYIIFSFASSRLC